MGHEIIPDVVNEPPQFPLELTYKTIRTFPGKFYSYSESFVTFDNTYNEVIRCFHQFVYKKSTNFSLFEQLKKKTNFLQFHSFFLSLPVEKEIKTNIYQNYL